LGFVNKVMKAWNAFRSAEVQALTQDPTIQFSGATSFGGVSPSRQKLRFYNDRSIISSIYTRVSVDVAAVALHHIMVDDEKRYVRDMQSNLALCLNFEPNKDQGPRAWRQDVGMTLCDKGVAAIVPIDTLLDNDTEQLIDIFSLRVGEVVQWFPNHVKVNVYNEKTGKRQDLLLEKQMVAIVENPLSSVMNEPLGTLQRLTRKLALLDTVDEASSSGKLDLIIQLPYAIKTEARRLQAEQRRVDIEMQLKGSQYGIAYTDGTEKITQLNRPVENNLLKQIEYLTNQLYDQLGITAAVMNGTADEAAMINYYNRTVEPFIDAVVEAMQRTFIGMARTIAGERIHYFRNPFKLMPMAQFAEVADKLNRNEILTGNEIRDAMGYRPHPDPKADQLVNSNINPNLPQSDTQSVA
jgi:hypothetical protein